MFVPLTKRTKFLVRVRSFIKRTNTNELPAERFTNCLLNVQFVCGLCLSVGSLPHVMVYKHKLTPMRVAIIRMMPVIHARVRLTRSTSAIKMRAASPEASFSSSNHLGDALVANFMFSVSLAEDLVKTTIPTISPVE
ncbi:hypothetical protein Hanom_Chr15g01398551 [Helianthus anomalus]